MISFEGFVMEGSAPIYMQIIYYIKRLVTSGAVVDGDELPSRRVISALLGVNPNTVQKAYRILEEEGIIISRPGAKSCICIDEEGKARLKEEMLKNDILSAVSALKQAGLDKNQAMMLMERYWE